MFPPTESISIVGQGRTRTAAPLSGQYQVVSEGMKRQSTAKHSWLKVHRKGLGELQPARSTAPQSTGATLARRRCAADMPASNSSGTVTQQRCLVDAGLLHGRSTRVSWTATGTFAHSRTFAIIPTMALLK